MKGTAAVLDWIDEYPVIVRQKENTSATSYSPWGPAPENEARINDVVEGQRSSVRSLACADGCAQATRVQSEHEPKKQDDLDVNTYMKYR